VTEHSDREIVLFPISQSSQFPLLFTSCPFIVSPLSPLIMCLQVAHQFLARYYLAVRHARHELKGACALLIVCRTFTAVDESLTWSECIGCHYCNEKSRRICCDTFWARCVPAKCLFLILFATSFHFYFTYEVELSVALYFRSWAPNTSNFPVNCLAFQLRNLVVVFFRERGEVSERVGPRWCFDVACDSSHDYRKSDCPINVPVCL